MGGGGGFAKLRIARAAFNLLTVTFMDLLQNVCGEMYVSLDGLLKCGYISRFRFLFKFVDIKCLTSSKIGSYGIAITADFKRMSRCC